MKDSHTPVFAFPVGTQMDTLLVPDCPGAASAPRPLAGILDVHWEPRLQWGTCKAGAARASDGRGHRSHERGGCLHSPP